MGEFPPSGWMILQKFLIVLVVCVAPGSFFSAGPPTSVCQSMLPNHGSKAQTTDPPFSITVNPSGYSPYRRLQVSIRGPFRGFMLQARSAKDDYPPVGAFSHLPAGSKTLNCDHEEDTFIHDSSYLKSGVEVSWDPPTESAGDLVFVATVVEDVSTYWVAIESDIVKDYASRYGDSRGETFVLMFMDIQGDEKLPELYLTSSSADTITVTISTAVNNYKRDLGVSSTRPGFDSLSTETRLRGSVLENKGVLVTAEGDISLFGVNKERFSLDTFLVLPIDSLGVEYYAVSYEPGEYTSQIGVVAVESGTEVSIVLPKERDIYVEFDGKEYESGEIISVQMGRLDALQLQSVTDMTGCHIYSNKPIAVFSGNKRAEIAGEPQTADHLVSQLIPVKSWGQTFVTVPFPDRSSGDLVRVVASEPETRLTVSNQTADIGIVIAEPGDFAELPLASSEIHSIEANRPIQVVQFGKSHFAADQSGDTTMLLVPSVDQYINEYRFSTPDASTDPFLNNFAMVVIAKDQADDLLLDDTPLSDLDNLQWTDVPGNKPQMAATAIPVRKGAHYIRHPDPGVTFGLMLYGYTDEESYSMPGGMQLFEMSLKDCVPFPQTPGDGIDNDCDGDTDEETCNGSDDDNDGHIDEDCDLDPLSGGCTHDYQGNEFVLTFLENFNSELPLEVYIVAPTEDVTVTVQLPLLGNIFDDQEFTVKTGEVRRVELPSDLQTTGTASGEGGVLIRASGDVNVQAMNSEDTRTASCGGFQVIPTDGLGQEYFVMSLWPENEGEFEYSQFAIVATERDTDVTIIFPFGRGVVIEYEGERYDEDIPLTLSLDAYQTLQVQSDSFQDLTGTRIQASRNIAVFSGNLVIRTDSADDATTDHTIEQMTPTFSWGTEFGVAALPDQEDGYIVHFVTREKDTVVEINGDVYEMGDAGSYLNVGVHVPDGTYTIIRAEKPILVAQIAKSHTTSSQGGPAMVLVPPVQRYRSNYTFAVPFGEIYQTFLLLVLEKTAGNDLRLNDAEIDIQWGDIPNTSPQLVGGHVQIDNGRVHRVVQLEDVPFGAYIYGHDNKSCSFAYVAGMCLRDLSETAKTSTNPTSTTSTLQTVSGTSSTGTSSVATSEVTTPPSTTQAVDSPFISTTISTTTTTDASITGDCVIDYRGQEFFFSFPESSNDVDKLKLWITTPSSSTVFLTLDAPLLDLGEKRELEIFPGETTFVDLPVGLRALGSGIQNTGINVRASDEVVLYGFNFDEGGCGGFQVMPTDALGFNYYVMSSPPDASVTDSYSELLVVATEDETDVTFQLPFDVSIEFDGTTYDRDNPIEITLDKHQTFQLQSEDDLTGTRVGGTQRIAVFSGVTNLQTTTDTANSDFIVEQMVPLHSWGTRFGIVPFPDGNDGFVINYVTREPDTVIVINGDTYEEEYAGSFQEQGLSFSAGAFVGIESNKPILVSQMMVSQRVDTFGAPTLLMVPPVQQHKSEYFFAVPPSSGSVYDVFSMLVIEKRQEGGLRLNGNAFDEAWTEIPGSSPALSGTWVKIPQGEFYRLHHVDGVKFSALLYGHDNSSCAFGYSADTCLEDIRPLFTTTAGPTTSKFTTSTSASVTADVAGTCGIDNAGREFYVLFPESGSGNAELELFIGLVTGDSVEVTIEAPGFDENELYEPLELEAEEVTRFTIPADYQMEAGNMARKGVLVKANGDIFLSAMQKTSDSCGSYMAMPIDSLGYNHYVITHTIGTNERDKNEIAVLATEDETTVKLIFPKGRDLNVIYDDDEIGDSDLQVVLDKYEALQVQTLGDSDLSGTKVEASKKVAVYAGSFDGNEYTVEQMPPLHSYGKTFVVIDFPDVVDPSSVKILAPFPDTNVQVTDQEPFTSSASENVKTFTATEDYISIVSDKPILVSQFGDLAEPTAMIVPPVEQYKHSYVFIVPESSNSDYTVYLMIVIEEEKRGNLRLNDQYITNSGWTEVQELSPILSGKTLTVSGGVYRLSHDDKDVTFGATMFGVENNDCTFALAAGTCLEDIRPLPTTPSKPLSSPSISVSVTSSTTDSSATSRSSLASSQETTSISETGTRPSTTVSTPVSPGTCEIDDAGRQFFVLFPESGSDDADLELFVGLTSGDLVEVTIEAPGFDDNEVDQVFQLNTEQATRFTIPADYQMEAGNVARKGVLVKANGDIFLSALQKTSDSCGSHMAMPIDSLGYNHYVITHTIGTNERDKNEIAVLATEDETTVKLIFPKGRDLNVIYDDDEIGDSDLQVVLDKYEALQVQTLGDSDLSGTKVEASNKVAVYAGSFDANEYTVEQMPPLHSYGKTFVVIDFPDVGDPSSVKILAPFPDTNVQVTDHEAFVSSESENVKEFTVTKDYISIRSDKPILVSQFGDLEEPTALVVPPIEQYKHSYKFIVPESPNSDYTVYLMMVIQRDERDSLILNGGYISNSGWMEVPDTTPAMVGKTVTVDGGFHRLSHENPNVKFGATLFGAESYFCTFTMAAGMCLDDIREMVQTTTTATDSLSSTPTDKTSTLSSSTKVTATDLSTATTQHSSADKTLSTLESTTSQRKTTPETSVTSLSTQRPATKCQKSNRGKEFVVVFMENEANDIELELFAATDNPSVEVSVQAPLASDIYDGQSFELSAGDMAAVTLPGDLRMKGSTVEENGVYITATEEIVVYGLNRADQSCGAFLVFPVDALSHEYLLIAWWPPSDQTQVGIVATEDDTTVALELHETHGNEVEFDGKVYVSGERVEVSLDRFETLQLQDVAYSDLTGSVVSANKPIAVFSGNKYTSIPADNEYPRDSIVEQIPPIETLGTNFVLLRTPDRLLNDVFVVVANESDTRVYVSDGDTILLGHRGDLRSIDPETVLTISADKPVLVAQFVQTRDSSSFETRGDPAMTVLTPVEQFRSSYTFLVPESEDSESANYLSIVSPSGAENEILLDNRSINSEEWVDVPDSEFVTVSLTIEGGMHRLEHVEGAKFGAYIFGIRDQHQCAYAYTTGLCLDDLDSVVIPTSRNPTEPSTTGLRTTTTSTTVRSQSTEQSTSELPTSTSSTSSTDRSTARTTAESTTVEQSSIKSTDTTLESSSAASSSQSVLSTSPMTDFTTENPIDGGYLGRKFYLAFLNNNQNDEDVKLMITTPSTETVTVAVTTPAFSDPYVEAFVEVKRGENVVVRLPRSIRPATSDVTPNGVFLTATGSIAVNSLNLGSCSSYLALPIDVLGKEYYTVTWWSAGTTSEVGIVTGEDNTFVQVKLPPNVAINFAGTLYRDEATIEIELDAFEVAQLLSESDLSGLYIRSDKNVAVFSGNTRVSVRDTRLTDQIAMQLTPVETWGRTFVLNPIPGTGMHVLQVHAAENGTLVTINGEFWQVLQRGTFENLYSSEAGPLLIESTKPVLTVQFSSSPSGDNDETAPAALLIPPLEQHRQEYYFSTPDLGSESIHYILVVLDEDDLGNILLDGVLQELQDDAKVDALSLSMYAGYIRVEEGAHHIELSGSLRKFAAYVYGVLPGECAYGFPAGMDARALAGDEITTTATSTTEETETATKSTITATSSPQSTSTEYSFTPKPDNVLDSLGTLFYVMFLNHSPNNGSVELLLTTPSEDPVVVDVSAPLLDNPVIEKRVLVERGKRTTVVLPPTVRSSKSGKLGNTIVVKSSDLIAVSTLNEAGTCAGYLALPLNTLGKGYLISNWWSQNSRSALGIVATEDNTRVSVALPTGNAVRVTFDDQTYDEGTVIEISLNKFELAQLLSPSDFSGINVVANKDIAVFSGVSNVYIGPVNNTLPRDQLAMQLFPVSRWGSQFILSPLPGQPRQYWFQVQSAYDNTDVVWSTEDKLLQFGEFAYGPRYNDTHMWIETSKPTMVVQFSNSALELGQEAAPSAILIPPVEQFRSEYYFSTPALGAGEIHFLMLFVEESMEGGLILDDIPVKVSSEWTYVENSAPAMLAAYLEIEEGAHILYHEQTDAVFTAYIYGTLPQKCAYGYPAGMQFENTGLTSTTGTTRSTETTPVSTITTRTTETSTADTTRQTETTPVSTSTTRTSDLSSESTVQSTESTTATETSITSSTKSTTTLSAESSTGSSSESTTLSSTQRTSSTRSTSLSSSTTTGEPISSTQSTVTTSTVKDSTIQTTDTTGSIPLGGCQKGRGLGGRSFIVMFLENSGGEIELELLAASLSNVPVEVTIEAPKANGLFDTYKETISSGEAAVVSLPAELRATGTRIESKGILITASENIIVYALDTSEGSCGGFLVLPIHSLGLEYHVVAWWPPSVGTQFGIVATEDDTEVDIFFYPYHGTKVTFDRRLYKAGERLNIALNAYESAQVQDIYLNDLSGTLIISNKPVAVFSGNRYTSISRSSKGPRDGTVEQMPPTSTWGKEFVLAGTADTQTTDVYVAMTKEIRTKVRVSDGQKLRIGHAGETRPLRVDSSVRVTSDKPIMIAKFVQSEDSDPLDQPGDPAMAVVTPVEQYSREYTVLIPEPSTGDSVNYLSLAITKGQEEGILLDGEQLESIEWESVRSAPYFTAAIKVGSGVHTLSHLSDTPFGAFVIGIRDEPECAFAYPAGACLGDLTTPPTTAAAKTSPSTTTTTPTTTTRTTEQTTTTVTKTTTTLSTARTGSTQTLPTLPPDECQFPNEGREFVVMFMENVDGAVELELFATSTHSVEVEVKAPLREDIYAPQSLELYPGEVARVSLPSQLRMSRSALSDKGIVITATDTIVLYGLNQANDSCGAFLVFPTDALAFNYYAVAWWPPSTSTQIGIVATQDDTNVVVTFHPWHGTEVVYNGRTYYQGDELELTMDRYQSLQLQDKVNSDLSGTKISADKPVAVFSGNRFTSVTLEYKFPRDGTVEQMLPLHAWGRNFVLVPTPDRPASDVYVIVSRDDATSVEISDGQTLFIRDRNTKSVVVNIRATLVADKPIMVAKFVQSEPSDTFYLVGEPAMTVLTPTEQFRSGYTVLVPEVSSGRAENYMTLIAERDDTDRIEINGLNLDLDWESVRSSEMAAATFLIEPGLYIISHADGEKFGSYIFGVREKAHCSYSYAAGLCLDDIRGLATSTTSPRTSTPGEFECPEGSNDYFGDPFDCNRFYQCANGVKHLQDCPEGLHFSQEDSTCVLPEDAGCLINDANDAVDTEFILMFMENPPNTGPVYLLITTPYSRVVQVNITTPPAFQPRVKKTVYVKRGESVTVELPPNIRITGSEAEPKGVRIVASDPISVVTLNGGSCASYLALPVQRLGTSYYGMTWEPGVSGSATIGIQATDDDTNIQVTLPDTPGINVNFDGKAYGSGDVIRFTRDAVGAARIIDAVDLTGTLIESDKPVAVFVGNTDTIIGNGTLADQTASQMIPYDTWGTSFVSQGIPDSLTGYYLKIMAGDRTTNVKVDGVETAKLSARQFTTVDVTTNDARWIEADGKILVIQYVKSRTEPTDKGAPAALSLPPTQQFQDDYSFSTPGIADPSAHYIFIVAEATESANILLDTESVDAVAGWVTVPGSVPSMVAKVINITEGDHRVRHRNSNSRFGLYVYGISPDDCAYAFPAGMNLFSIEQPEISTVSSETSSSVGVTTAEDVTTTPTGSTDVDTASTEAAIIFDDAYVGCEEDNRGREFVMMFLEQGSADLDLEILPAVVQPEEITVNVSTPKWNSPSVFETMAISGGSVESFTINNTLRHKGVGKASKGVLVTSTDDISLYALNREPGSCDGFLALPTDVLGTEYYPVTHFPPSVFTQVGVVAVEDGTEIKITLPASQRYNIQYDGTTYNGGDTIRVDLEKYETFQIQDRGDLSWAHIESNQPVAVFSGNIETEVKESFEYGDRSHLVEQMVPVKAWGKVHYSLPTPDRTTVDWLKIIASEDDTTLSLSGLGTKLMSAGEVIMASVSVSSWRQIRADKPILVAQIARSRESNSTLQKDPAMTLLPPEELFKSQYIFATPNIPGVSFTNYVMVVIDEAELSGLMLDGKTVDADGWELIGDSAFMVGKALVISDGIHYLKHTNNVTFGAYVYGSSLDDCAYAYPAGMCVRPLIETTTVNPPAGETTSNSEDQTITSNDATLTTDADLAKTTVTTSDEDKATTEDAGNSLQSTSVVNGPSSVAVGDSTITATTEPALTVPPCVCTVLAVNSADLQPQYAGKYYQLDDLLNGQPVYKLDRCPAYIYAINDTWLISAALGSPTGDIRADDAGPLPVDVTSWVTYNSNGGTWENDGTVSVDCYCQNNCSIIEFKGKQARRSLPGKFILENYNLNGHSVYKHQEKELFFYYYTSPTCRYWMVGPELGGSVALVYTDSSSADVRNINGIWRLLLDGRWVLDSNFKLLCV